MHSAPSLILIAVAAFFLPLVGNRFRLPAVVLEILFGVLIGPQVLQLVESSEFLDAVAELGFYLLMFLSGFEIDLGAIRRQGAARVTTCLVVFLLTLLCAYGASTVLGLGLFGMFVLATTSVGLVVPTLRNTRRTFTPVGQLVVLSAVLADFLTLVGVTVFAVVHESDSAVSLRLLEVPGFFLAIAFFLLVLRRAAWWFPEKFDRLFRQDDPEELGMRAALALLLTFVGLSTLFHIEPVLGAFLAGSIFALVFRHRGSLETQLSGFAWGFMIPVFFINVGLEFELRAFAEPENVEMLGMLLVAAVLVKVLPAGVLFVLGLSAREVLASGLLLSARLSLIIAVAELGVDLGLIDRNQQAGIILLATVTATFAPTLFQLLLPPLPASEGAPAVETGDPMRS